MLLLSEFDDLADMAGECSANAIQHEAIVPLDLVLADLYWFGLGENYACHADYFTDLHDAWVVYKYCYFDLLHGRRFYGYDLADQPRIVDRAFDGKRIL